MIKIPKDWKQSTPVASELIENKFLAFKTPLDRPFNGDLKIHKFNVKSVFDYLEENDLKMGLWIDLSIPDRFDPADVENRGCLYIKEKCGHKVRYPRVRVMKKLTHMVRKFISENPNEIIGVHCTHGHNRTGFAIVTFMIEIYGWTLECALAEFARVRPPGIYRDYMIEELRKRYSTNCSSPALSVPHPVRHEQSWRSVESAPCRYFKKIPKSSDKKKKRKQG